MLSDEDVRHVAKLARIALTDEEVAKFGPQLSGVLDYVEMLKEVDTEGVEGTSQVTGLVNVMGKDELDPEPQATREELLGCTELPVETAQIRVKKTI